MFLVISLYQSLHGSPFTPPISLYPAVSLIVVYYAAECPFSGSVSCHCNACQTPKLMTCFLQVGNRRCPPGHRSSVVIIRFITLITTVSTVTIPSPEVSPSATLPALSVLKDSLIFLRFSFTRRAPDWCTSRDSC